MAKKARQKSLTALRSNTTQIDELPSDPAAIMDIVDGDITLARLVKQFNDSASTTDEARKESEIWRDYYDNKQWSDTELKTLEARGQPAITDNRIKDKVDYTLGLERKMRTDPKAQPRTPDDADAADAATAGLRYVAECNHFEQTKSKVFENMIIEGFGGAEVIVDSDRKYTGTQNSKVCVRYVRWDRLYYDGHSLSADFSDARYMGIVKWMDFEEAKAMYPQLSNNFDVFTSTSFGWSSPTYDDKPRWFDRGRKRIQFLEHYYKQGDTWMRAVFSRVGFVEEPAESVYVDSETGEKECPLILQSLYVDRVGNRYGLVKRYKDLQDEINKRRSKSLHLLSVNRAIAEVGAVADVNKARIELAKPDGWVERTPQMEIEVLTNVDMAEGQFKLLQEAQQALSATGPNEALLGATGDQSGRKTQLDQQGGLITLGVQGDGIRFWQKRVMTAVFNRMKQFWKSEQYIRITEGEQPKFSPLNSTYPDSHQSVKTGKVQAGSPMNALGELEVDIIIDEAPQVATVEQEDFQTLASLAGDAHIPIPPQAIVEASGLSSARKKRVLDAMSGKLPDGTSIPPEVQQQIQQQQGQLQQIAQAQQQKATEQQQTEAQLGQQKADALLQQTKAQAALDKVTAAQNALEAQFAGKQTELEAQMTTIKAQIATLNAKEVELKALQLLAAQNLQQTQDAANAIVQKTQQENAVTVLQSKLEAQESQHQKQVSDLGVQHNQQLHQEREKARAAQASEQETKAAPDKPAKPPKPRQVTVQRDAQGRISGAIVH